MADAVTALREHLAPLQDLAAISMGLSWDQQVVMPPRGAGARAEALGTVEAIRHERFVAAETGRLLEAAERQAEGGEDPLAADLVAVVRRDWEKARRVPSELAAEMARAAAAGYEAWTRARAASDWSLFAPQLERMLGLKERYAGCFPDAASVYDALLDDYEPGARAAEVAALFAEVKAGLVPLLDTILAREGAVSDACTVGDFPRERQEALLRRVLPALGFDRAAWRLDVAPHPFAVNFARDDVRITTRYDPHRLTESLFCGLHETGHGLYEAGSAPELERTPLAGGVSLGLHESQSRLWENCVGRSRPFAEWILPLLRETYPGAFDDVTPEDWFGAVNVVARSLIRTDADEVTYPLHVILRFELEQELVGGRLAVADLPEAWNARMREYLGVEVPDDAHGVLQDVHWSEGHVGYFPTYALGSVMAAQIWAAARAAMPDLDDQLAGGSFAPLREWLREHLHRHGRRAEPREALERVVGGPIDAAPYLEYLRGKYGALYGVPASLGQEAGGS